MCVMVRCGSYLESTANYALYADSVIKNKKLFTDYLYLNLYSELKPNLHIISLEYMQPFNASAAI